MDESGDEGGAMGDVVRILVADDHPLTRDGIKAALSMDAELEVVAEASDGQEAVSLAEAVRPDVILMAVHLAAEGSAVIHPNLTRQFIEEIRQLTRGEQSVSTLSGREVEVLQMIAYGSTNREVAEALHISPQTVKTYLERIFTKLGVSDRTRAVAVALKHGIVE